MSVNPNRDNQQNPTLDPADWESFRELCHEMLDGAIDDLRTLDEQPVWKPVPDNVKAELSEPLPIEPQGPERVCRDYRKLIAPYSNGNRNPSFFGWVHGSGTPTGMLAELLASSLNNNLGGREHAAVYVEHAVIEWARNLFGFPGSASGILLSGTSMATLLGLNVARNKAIGSAARCKGLYATERKLIAYTSNEAHSSVEKAIEMLGQGSEQLRRVAVDDRNRLRTDHLERLIQSDLRRGHIPFAVIATAGTVNTGAIDDLVSISEICRKHKIWLHVDGAFGASLALSPVLQNRISGIERADSLAFDFHKWMHVPYDAGCLLVRDGQIHQNTFVSRPEYLDPAQGGLASADQWYCDYGPELSRGFRALKVWFTLKTHGTKAIGASIEENCRLAQQMSVDIRSRNNIELAADVSLNIVCLRYVDDRLTDELEDELNQSLVTLLQELGIAAPSTTTIDKRRTIRVCITNHRTQLSHIRKLLDAVEKHGRALANTLAESRKLERQTSDTSIAPRPGSVCLNGGHMEHIDEIVRDVRGDSELRELARDARIEIDPQLETPFVVHHDGRIVLDAAHCCDRNNTRQWLRHALELRMLRRCFENFKHPLKEMAVSLLACRYSSISNEARSDDSRLAFKASMSSELAIAYEAVLTDPSHLSCLIESSGVIESLLRLQKAELPQQDVATDQRALAELDQLVANLAPFCVPTEQLLIQGGDDRIGISEETGKNRYACSPIPDPLLHSFSSSTATTISSESFDHCESTRQKLIQDVVTKGCRRACISLSEAFRNQIKEHIGLHHNSDIDVVLAPSGTDCELFTLNLLTSNEQQPVANILISPDESGSGLLHAAKGCHYSSTTPFGRSFEVGEALGEINHVPIVVETVNVRDESGHLNARSLVHEQIEKLVRRNRELGRKCLLHLMDCSKTGWRAPTLDFVRTLRNEFSNGIEVIVDACQFRTSPEDLRTYIEEGFVVQLSGSKFYAGPAFCGAMIVPRNLMPKAKSDDYLPQCLRDYSSVVDWPSRLNVATQALNHRPNIGLLIRWSAALRQMSLSRAVSAELIEQVHHEFQRFNSMLLDIVDTVTPIDAFTSDDDVSALPRARSIFSFLVRLEHGTELNDFADMDQAKLIHQLMTKDISDQLRDAASDQEQRIAATRFHLGQPVAIKAFGRQFGALRICLSAEIISRIAFDQSFGASPSDRMRMYMDLNEQAFQKIQLIAKHWPRLTGLLNERRESSKENQANTGVRP